MADLPELWTERTPTPSVAGEVVRVDEQPPLPAVLEPEPPAEPEAGRERGPFLTYLCMPWSYGDHTTTDTWHRWKCRFGRHVIIGGHTMQMGGTVVFVERQCRWCGAVPA